MTRQNYYIPHTRHRHTTRLDKAFYKTFAYLSYFSFLTLISLSTATITAIKVMTVVNG